MKNSKWVKMFSRDVILKLKDKKDFIFSITNISKELNIPERRCGELLKYYDIDVIKLTTNKRFSKSEWLEECKKKHGDNYDYTESIYVNRKTLVTIKCKIHGDIKVNPSTHMRGSGCNKCSHRESSIFKPIGKEEFIEVSKEIHDNRYDYSLVHDFRRLDEKVKIICKEHGIFEQKA